MVERAMGVKVELITSFNSIYYHRYGHRLVETFLEFVDPSVRLVAYSEEPVSLPDSPRLESRDLLQTSFPAFLEAALPKVETKIGAVSDDPDERVGHGRYLYEYDAIGFSKKAIAFINGARRSAADFIFWIDADVVFRRPTPLVTFTGLFLSADIVYFGREEPHSETGFFGLRKNRASATFLERYASYYEGSDPRVFDLDGWTDSHVFDAAMAEMKKSDPPVIFRNLSTNPTGHVMASSPLAVYLDHQKGYLRKKAVGR